MRPKKVFQFGIVALAVLVATVTAIIYAPPVSAGQPPVNECPPGNLVAGKGCKWDLGFHEITSAKFDAYRVPGANACYAGFEFSPYDYQNDMARAPTKYVYVHFGKKDESNLIKRVPFVSYDFLARTDTEKLEHIQFGDGSLIVRVGLSYKLGSRIPPDLVIEASRHGSESLPPEVRAEGYVLLYASEGGAPDRDIIPETSRSPWLPIPAEVNDFSALVFDCLEDIRRERENKAKQEELRAKNAAEQRAADKARSDAEAKAELQRIELEAAKQIQQKALETELFKTQALRGQLEQEQLIIAAWNKVVEIRLAGAQERAKITNAFMAEVESDKAAFVASVQAKVEELQRLQEINETLRAAIQAHNQTILDELAIQQSLEEKQKQAIQDLEVQPSGTSTPSN